jgi:hypothetical protein
MNEIKSVERVFQLAEDPCVMFTHKNRNGGIQPGVKQQSIEVQKYHRACQVSAFGNSNSVNKAQSNLP